MTYIQIGLFVGYVVYVWQRWGILTSISASSYLWKDYKAYIFFSGWLWALGVLNLFQPMGFYGGLMSMGLAVAGVTTEHKKGPSGRDEWHTFGSVLAIASGLIGLIVLHGLWLPSAVFAAGFIMLLFSKTKNWIWWTEILAMGAIGWGYLSI